jgi:hypothetical protein
VRLINVNAIKSGMRAGDLAAKSLPNPDPTITTIRWRAALVDVMVSSAWPSEDPQRRASESRNLDFTSPHAPVASSCFASPR